jgi:hypothetical protein
MLCMVVVSARFLLCCYRAVVQSITYDEALTFNRFVKGPWSSIYAPFYDANNHILYSILAKLSIYTFGLSEFTLRLPSLIAGAFLIFGIFRVLQAISSRLMRWMFFVALSLHPLLLDFSVAARGYSLGLALFVWALYFSLKGRYLLTGALLGLAVSANLTNVFPALGLMAAAVLLQRCPPANRFGALCKMMFPAAVIFAAICFASLSSAHRDNFYYGYPSPDESAVSLIRTSFQAYNGRLGLFGSERAVHLIGMYLLPSVGAFILISSAVGFLRNRDSPDRFVPVSTLLITSLGLLSAHVFFDVKYPADRTGLYLILLFSLAWAVAIDVWRNSGVLCVHFAIYFLVILQFCTAFHTSFFPFWRADMYTKVVAQRLKDACKDRPDDSVSVSSTWYLQQALEFYRQYLGIRAMRPVEVRLPTVFHGSDFYMLAGPDAKEVTSARLRVLLSDRESGIVFATEPR